MPAEPVAATYRDPLWDVTPASIKATAPAKVEAAPEIHDLFAEKLEETGGEELPPEGPKPPKTEKQNRSLPWLIVLLVLVIAAAAVAAYFLYFRDTGGNAGSPATTVADITTTTAQGSTAPAVWTNLTTSGDTPAARSYFAMAYDPTTDRTILFGGSGGDTKFGDTWALDLTSKTWTKIPATGGGPSARDYCQMVYDPVGTTCSSSVEPTTRVIATTSGPLMSPPTPGRDSRPQALCRRPERVMPWPMSRTRSRCWCSAG